VAAAFADIIDDNASLMLTMTGPRVSSCKLQVEAVCFLLHFVVLQ
jgi:hypothetical protein